MNKITLLWNEPECFTSIMLGRDLYSWYDYEEHYWNVPYFEDDDD